VADGFEVHPETLRQGGSGILDAAQRLSDEWQRFDGTVRGMGPMFGDDPIAGLIGASYQAAHGIAERSLGTVVDALGEFGSGLCAMADRYEEIEQVNSDGFQSLHRLLG
jgi:hypothetical protein